MPDTLPVQPVETPPGWLDQAVDQNEVSRITGVPTRSLEAMRCRGDGPPFIKIGKRVRYFRRDVFGWLNRRRRVSTGDTGNAAA